MIVMINPLILYSLLLLTFHPFFHTFFTLVDLSFLKNGNVSRLGVDLNELDLFIMGHAADVIWFFIKDASIAYKLFSGIGFIIVIYRFFMMSTALALLIIFHLLVLIIILE